MNNSGRGKCSVTGKQKLGLLADLHHATALQDEVEFVLSLMRMGCVLLIRFKGIQTNKEKFTLRQGALGHLLWRKRGVARESLHEHSCQFTPQRNLGTKRAVAPS